jgi:zinc/manganese transport system substrate-binding protein/manganese/iron transport system substrate-binding protein
MFPRTLASLLAVLPLLVAACAGSGASTGSVQALGTTTQIQDFLKIVGGDRVRVTGLLGPDADAHEYEPKAEDARKVAEARVIFSNGAGLEGSWLEDLTKNARTGTRVVDLSEGIETLKGETREHGDHQDRGEKDPHIWFDPLNAKKMVQRIRDELIIADPAGADVYRRNTSAYERQLDELDQEIRRQIETIPAANRKLVSNHDTFGYYINRYGLTFVGSVIPSLSSDAQPSAAEVTKLVEAIRAQGVKAIFAERSINPKLSEQIAREAGVKVYATLYSDSLGPAGSDGDTYLKMMRFNTKTIVEGLR